MKKLQQLCAACVFTLVLTATTFGGQIETPIMQPPPPAPASSTTTLAGIETEPSVQNLQWTSDSVADISLNLLQTVLAMF